MDMNRLTERQREVLDAALALLMDTGDQLTMTGVARRASCSKETLYKWFGDRDGLLTATVQWQASKVRVEPVDLDRLDVAGLTAVLKGFAADWLRVVSSPTSVALNRLAIAHAGSDKPGLGAIVLENGRFALARRLTPVLEAARKKGLLAFENGEMAFRTFFGLVARDVQVRLLLGDRMDLNEKEILGEAAEATRQFLALYGRGGEPIARQL
jgi:AcrR family transcriptional regulator